VVLGCAGEFFFEPLNLSIAITVIRHRSKSSNLTLKEMLPSDSPEILTLYQLLLSTPALLL
jgi:hypothetical protein